MKDVLKDDFCIPRGDANLPYSDLEQGYRILIVEHDDFVYILNGNFDDGNGYHTWFQVKRNRYLEQWEKAVDLCRKKGVEWS